MKPLLMFLYFMYCPLLSFYTIRQFDTARCNTVLQNCKKNFPTRWNREILHLLSYKPKNSCKNFYFFLFVYLSSARAAYTTITAIKPRTTTFKICVKISAIFSPINRQTKSHTKQMPECPPLQSPPRFLETNFPYTVE